MDFVAIFALIVAFFAGFAAKMAFDGAVSKQALRIANTRAGEKGRQAQKDQEGELTALITEATILFKEGKAAGEDLKTTAARVLPQLVAKYPTVVMKHSKKLLKMAQEGGFESLEGLL